MGGYERSLGGDDSAPAPRVVNPLTSEAGAPDPTERVEGHDWRPARFMVIVAHPDDADF